MVSAFLPATLLIHMTLVVEAVRPSAGCHKSLPSKFTPGETTVLTRDVLGTMRRKHSISLPSMYENSFSEPAPLLLFFHGYSGDFTSCGIRCTEDAPDNGFVTVSMTGYGGTRQENANHVVYNSWKFYGSSSDDYFDGGKYNESICNTTYYYENDNCHQYEGKNGCDCNGTDLCGWTTCLDSVEQVVDLLDLVEEEICVDLDRVWAGGCSNGGMFVHELARDSRTAHRLAGIVPIVGLPHWGYATGPLIEGISYFGMFGDNDTTVTAISNSDVPGKAVSEYIYTSYDKTLEYWTKGNGCEGDGQMPLDEDEYLTETYGYYDCIQGCKEKKSSSHVVACLFEGGHICYQDEVPWQPMFEFMLSQQKGSSQEDTAIVLSGEKMTTLEKE